MPSPATCILGEDPAELGGEAKIARAFHLHDLGSPRRSPLLSGISGWPISIGICTWVSMLVGFGPDQIPARRLAGNKARKRRQLVDEERPRGGRPVRHLPLRSQEVERGAAMINLPKGWDDYKP